MPLRTLAKLNQNHDWMSRALGEPNLHLEPGFNVEGKYADEAKNRRKRKARERAKKEIRIPENNPALRTKVLRMAAHLSPNDLAEVVASPAMTISGRSDQNIAG